ncbi:hypothetical protein K8S17_04015 [bacterium]|nr:hypothetical protein [bacterium]
MSFVTAVNCMDGRVQLPVIHYLQERFGVPYVDVISEAGPVRVLAADGDSEEKTSILRRVGVSVNVHGSKLIAVIAHVDCGGNPAADDEQKEELSKSVHLLSESFPGTCVLGLWLEADWSVDELLRAGAEPPEKCDEVA